MKTSNLLLIALTMSIAACSTDSPPPPPTAAAQPAPPLPNSNIYSTDVKALQKAKDVQNVVNQQQQNADKQLQDQGG